MERLRQRPGRDDEEVVARSRRTPAAPPVAELLLRAQRGAGNAAVARAIARAPAGGLLSGATQMLGELVSAAMTIRLGASVGRGGENAPADVDAIRGRLQALGFPAPAGPEREGGGDLLGEAIARYQGEVVRTRSPDGRVDPGGRTLRAINAGQRAPEPEGAPAADGSAAPGPAAPAPTGPVPIPYPNTAGAEPAAPAASGGGGAALATAGPAVAGVVAEITRLGTDLDALLAESKAADKLTAKANKARAKGEKEQTLNLGQETGPKRDRLVDGIEKVRAQIAALTPASSGLDAKELAAAKAELYRRADHLSPYYFQMVNANILYDSDTKGGGRTCNVTSVSMCLEAMGKSMDDFTGDTTLLSALAAQFTPALTDASDTGGGSLAELRLPDFLQLLAVAKCMDASAAGMSPQDPGFAKAVEKGRAIAVNKILQSGWFIELTRPFGVEVGQDSSFDARTTELIDIVGEINRKAIPSALKANKKKKDEAKPEADVKASVVEYYDQSLVKDIEKADATVKELESKPPGTGKEQKKLDEKVRKAKAALAHLKELQATGIYGKAIDPEGLNELQPLDVYKAGVQAALSRHLDAGHQIVGHVYHHFIRVEGVEEDGVRIDDPGSYTRHDYLLPWKEAREIGGFTRFTVLK